MKFKNRAFKDDSGETYRAEINSPSDKFIKIYKLRGDDWVEVSPVPVAEANRIPDNLSALQQALYPELTGS
ncbi:MAG: hypothetical protein GY820_25820 [Gammaproteobacteria bacterium]|nr:hypothetical protein [Gammaproteobacteria bacterium]